MTQWYGNLMNRLDEGKGVPEIKEGMDITMYLWSDRNCYYITEVVDQKHIKVKPYVVIADRDKPGGMGHQDWLYFKTNREANEYLKQHGFDGRCENEPVEQDWEYRYNKWQRSVTFTEDNYCTERELKSLATKGYYKRFFNLSGEVSFGVRDYYYDWEF